MLKYLIEMMELAEELVQPAVFKRYASKLQDIPKPADEIGRGVFSRVVPHPEDPHLVQKYNIHPLGPKRARVADGFEQYVDFLIKYNLMDNVHFPKVYKVKTVTDAGGERKNFYEIEKLYPLRQMTDEELASISENVFGSSYTLVPSNIAERIEYAVTDTAWREKIKSESLKNAIEALVKISKESDFSLDIHEDNIMFRRTPHGPQLVISDPFSFLKAGRASKYRNS